MYEDRNNYSNSSSNKFRRRTPGKCSFCEHKVEPNYKEVKTLKPLITEKGKIQARSRTGTCQKHQRQLVEAIKRARFMALVPHVPVIG
jgi:small subunit ribosomal protein S18